MKRMYSVVTKSKNGLDEDLCGTFFTVLCLIASKFWGKFEVLRIDRLEFYE